MTLSELRYLVALARERHFGRAAASCYVSQPTLSVAIKKLEDELGVALFERRKLEVIPTPIGERLVQQAQQVLEEAESFKRMASSGRDQLSEPLRLGIIYTIGPYLLPDLIPLLHEQAPEMSLHIDENYTARLSEQLKQGELDAIIIALPFNEPGVLTVPLYEEPFVVLLPSAHPWQAKKAINAGDLSEEDVLLLGAGHCFRDQVLQACPACLQSSNASGKTSLEGGSLETIRHMVASGMGISVLPCTAAGADRYSQRLLAIRRFIGTAPSRQVALAWRKTYPRPKAIEVLRRAILACDLSCTKKLGNGR